MSKPYKMKTINVHPDWYERFKAICENQLRTPGMQFKELIQLGEKHYGLNKKKKTKMNNNES